MTDAALKIILVIALFGFLYLYRKLAQTKFELLKSRLETSLSKEREQNLRHLASQIGITEIPGCISTKQELEHALDYVGASMPVTVDFQYTITEELQQILVTADVGV